MNDAARSRQDKERFNYQKKLTISPQMSQPSSPSSNPIATKVARVARLLRTKKRDLTTILQTAERILMRSFELDTKEKIVEKSEKHLRVKQENDFFQDALAGMDLIQLRVNEFLDEKSPDDLENIYSRICSYQTILVMPEFDALVAARPPKEVLPQRDYVVLDEKDNGSYAKKFAETKGSTQGMAERLRSLFPPPKTKPVLFSSRSTVVVE
jgi:hypothetical protein